MSAMPFTKPSILIARPVPQAVADYASQHFDAVIAEQNLVTEQALVQAQELQVSGIVFGGHLKLSAEAIKRLPDSVRVLSSTSVGFDHIDVEAARARGIVVTNAPSAITDCTADLAFMLLLCASRRAHEYGTLVREGWKRNLGFNELPGVRVSGKTLGIYGMGRIGRAVAQHARGFNMRVLYHDVQRLPEELEQGATYYETLEAMLPHCDALTLHAPATPETTGIINAQRLALLPRGAVFVNAARGVLVNEDDLVEALRSGHIRAAGLDTFQREPDPDPRLVELPNTFLTPHIGGATEETRTGLGLRALENALEVLSGRPALDPL